MRDPLHWVPIKYKLPLTVSVLYVLAFGIGGYLVTTDTTNVIAGRIRGQLEARALLAKQTLDARFDLAARRVEDFASDGFIRVQTAALVSKGAEVDVEQTKRRLIRHLDVNKLPLVPFFANATILDTEGRLVLAARESYPMIEQPYSVESATSPSESSATASFGSILPTDESRSFRACTVTTRLASLEGTRTIGYFQILLDVDRWLGPPGVHASIGSTESDGPPVRLRLHDPGGRALPIGQGSTAVVFDAGDGDDSPVIRHELELAVPGWSVDLVADRATAMAPLDSLILRFVSIGVVLVLVNLAVLFFPARFLIKPLLQLRNAAHAMTAGDETVRVPDTRSNDEIGDLSRAFNVMARSVEERAQRLKDSAQELAAQKTLIRLERDRLEGVIRSMQDGLFIMSSAGEVTFSNAAGHSLIERLAAAGGARERLLCSHGGSDGGCVECLAGRNVAPGSCMVKLDDRVYEIHVTPLSERRDAPAEGVYVSRDVTERLKQAEQQAHQERIHVVGELSAVVAHEVNNPLAAIVMFSQMLVKALEDDSDLKKHADVILRNADACRRTISNLLEMSAFPAPEIGEIDALDLLIDVGDFLAPLIQRKTRRFDVEAPEDRVILRGDEIQIRQVLVNLVMNAVQAGGDTLPSVSVRVRQTEESVVLEVEDDGPGVPDEIRDRIFEPFFSTKRPGAGTGLGLSTSRRIAESHGGRLVLEESEPGHTIFAVELPRDFRPLPSVESSTAVTATFEDPSLDARSTVRVPGEADVDTRN